MPNQKPEKTRWCPVMIAECTNNNPDNRNFCSPCPLDSLHEVASFFAGLKKDIGTFKSNPLVSQVMKNPEAVGMQMGVHLAKKVALPEEEEEEPKGWWPEFIICKDCGVKIEIKEEPKTFSVTCPSCGIENILTAIR